MQFAGAEMGIGLRLMKTRLMRNEMQKWRIGRYPSIGYACHVVSTSPMTSARELLWWWPMADSKSYYTECPTRAHPPSHLRHRLMTSPGRCCIAGGPPTRRNWPTNVHVSVTQRHYGDTNTNKPHANDEMYNLCVHARLLTLLLLLLLLGFLLLSDFQSNA